MSFFFRVLQFFYPFFLSFSFKWLKYFLSFVHSLFLFPLRPSVPSYLHRLLIYQPIFFFSTYFFLFLKERALFLLKKKEKKKQRKKRKRKSFGKHEIQCATGNERFSPSNSNLLQRNAFALNSISILFHGKINETFNT